MKTQTLVQNVSTTRCMKPKLNCDPDNIDPSTPGLGDRIRALVDFFDLNIVKEVLGQDENSHARRIMGLASEQVEINEFRIAYDLAELAINKCYPVSIHNQPATHLDNIRAMKMALNKILEE